MERKPRFCFIGNFEACEIAWSLFFFFTKCNGSLVKKRWATDFLFDLQRSRFSLSHQIMFRKLKGRRRNLKTSDIKSIWIFSHAVDICLSTDRVTQGVFKFNLIDFCLSNYFLLSVVNTHVLLLRDNLVGLGKFYSANWVILGRRET